MSSARKKNVTPLARYNLSRNQGLMEFKESALFVLAIFVKDVTAAHMEDRN